MSLGNTSQPSAKNCANKVNAKYIHGRPESELVPSRYALKVGAIDVMMVSDGMLSLPGAMLGHNVDLAVRAAWVEDMFLPSEVLEWALNAVVVRTGDRTILIDAGMGEEYPDLPRVGLEVAMSAVSLASRARSCHYGRREGLADLPAWLNKRPPAKAILPTQGAVDVVSR